MTTVAPNDDVEARFPRLMKFLATLPQGEVYHPYTYYMDKKVAIEEFLADIAPHLSVERRRELVAAFLEATDPSKPMLYKNRPAGEDFLVFWKREYGDRGLIPQLSQRLLDQQDPAAGARYKRLLNLDGIPPDLRMKKERDRKNRREREKEVPGPKAK